MPENWLANFSFTGPLPGALEEFLELLVGDANPAAICSDAKIREPARLDQGVHVGW